MPFVTTPGTKNIPFFFYTSYIVSECDGSPITFSHFLRHSLTIISGIVSQSWGYFCRPCLWEGISLVYMKFYFKTSQRIFWVTGAGSHMMMFSEQLSIRRHIATATANTLTTQYMVRFSHLTVQLPEMRLFHTLIKHSKYDFKKWYYSRYILQSKSLKNIWAIKKKKNPLWHLQCNTLRK